MNGSIGTNANKEEKFKDGSFETQDLDSDNDRFHKDTDEMEKNIPADGSNENMLTEENYYVSM